MGKALSEVMICGVSLKEYCIRMEEFHGARSPGLLFGGIMLDLALRELGETPYLNVVTETVVCLPDAVQLLTPCTLGNGFLQVFDWGKFALTVYDRMNLHGVRAWLEPEEIDRYPLIHGWFVRSSEAREKPSFQEFAPEILQHGDRLLRCRPVRLHRPLKETDRIPTVKCQECGEFYASRLGSKCPACLHGAYYLLTPGRDTLKPISNA